MTITARGTCTLTITLFQPTLASEGRSRTPSAVDVVLPFPLSSPCISSHIVSVLQTSHAFFYTSSRPPFPPSSSPSSSSSLPAALPSLHSVSVYSYTHTLLKTHCCDPPSLLNYAPHLNFNCLQPVTATSSESTSPRPAVDLAADAFEYDSDDLEQAKEVTIAVICRRIYGSFVYDSEEPEQEKK